MSLQAPARVAVATTESDAAQSQQIQEIASEVLRLRLVQSQYKQLEGQLRTTSEKLRDLLPDKAPHFSQYLEQGLRPGGTVGTLGGFHGGAEPESLLGIMECLCVVCNAQVSSRREDLVAACQWLLQDPKCLAETLASLPAAPGALSRRLAPYLLTCDSSWRGSLNEAGQCYEAFRSWLSCYYQYSLVSAQMEASAAQLQLQEQLLKELNKEPSPGTDIPRSTQVKSAVWRHSSGLRRSSSVQSTSSAGSRRSPSPSDVKAARPGDAGGRKSAGGAISLTRVSREASQKSPLGRSEKSLKTASQTPTTSQGQPPASRPSLIRPAFGSDKGTEPSPRTRLALGGHQPLALSGARPTRSATAVAPPGPPALSPRRSVPYSARGYVDPPKTLLSSRRQIVPAVRARRSPSREVPAPGSKAASARATPVAAKAVDGNPAEVNATAEPLQPESGQSASALYRSRSLHSISEPEVGVSPPLSTRIARHSETYSARLRPAQITPIASRLASSATQLQPRSYGSVLHSTGSCMPYGSVRTSRIAFQSTGVSGATLRPQPRTKPMVPSHKDAGLVERSGPRDLTPSAWALASSRSSPSLEPRVVLGCPMTGPVVREVTMATPRPLFSARAR